MQALFVALAAVVVVGVVVALWRPSGHVPAPSPAEGQPPPGLVAVPPVEIEYEKVEADGKKIFRYHLLLLPDLSVTVRVDDTDTTHLKESAQVKQESLRDLVSLIESSGFFALEPELKGLRPDLLESYDIAITIGRRSHRVRVENRVEPLPFKTVRERIEQFGHTELGLWAVQFSPDALRQKAREAFDQGRKLYEEREVNYGNLAAAIRSLTEVDFYLKTIDPKPDFYPGMLKLLEDARAALNEKYLNVNFSAEKAMRLQNYEEAATHLRILCELVPDRADSRHEDARRRLLEVESRLESSRERP